MKKTVYDEYELTGQRYGINYLVKDEGDLLALCSYTLAAGKPLCTGVSGTQFRYARALLPLFGSELVYTHAGTPTAAGQYHIREFRELWGFLTK